jgi:hypothetical protein
MSRQRNIVKNAAYPKSPTPHESPAAIENSTYDISFGSPGALLNLIIEKAPAKLKALAILLPIKSTIIAITVVIIISVREKFCE